MDEYQIEFEPLGRRGACPADQSLLEAARRLGVDLINICGGVGLCERCKIQVLSGRVSDPTLNERQVLSPQELADGYRLACMTYPLGHCKVGVPAESLSTPMRTQVEGLEAAAPLAPALHCVHVELPSPSLTHPLADAENLLHRVQQAGGPENAVIDITVLQELSTRLRDWNWTCDVLMRGREVIAIRPASSRLLGLAVDLGSTKLAAYLVDLGSGQTLAARGMMNPQISYGEDIVGRITYAMKSPAARDTLQRVVVEGLSQLAGDVCAEVGAARHDILEAVIVGNTAMHHLLLGLPLRQLALAPFVPAISGSLDVKARDIGLDIAPGAYLHCPPNIAGYVGSDHVAMLLATASEWSRRHVLALDIGTNTEISFITSGGDITSLSCASGPAFEGYHIQHGMRASRGAIERVRITSSQVHYQTIEGAPASGICGSGILDAVAQLSLAGVLSENGRIQAGVHPRVRMNGDQPEFLLAAGAGAEGRTDISVTQDDVREIQLAKAAIQTGIQVLIAESNARVEDIDQVIIAGAFGSYIDVANAVAIGLLPALPLQRFKQVGNAAGMGARLALLSTAKRAEAQALGARIRYIELATYPNFSNLFARNCRLKPGSYAH